MRDITALLIQGAALPGRGAANVTEGLPEGAAHAPAPQLAAPVDLGSYFSARAERYRFDRDSGAAYRRSLSPYRALAGRRLVRRASRRAMGLSNPAYLAATTGTQFLRVQIESARVKFTFSDPIAESLTPLRGVGGKRGEITCLSDAARDRLANRAWALGAEGHTPEVMITLTAPANWQEIYVANVEGSPLAGGRILKAHLQAFRKRLERFLKSRGLGSWSALWFLEFQRRGAPHIHLMLFGCKLPEVDRRALRNWCGGAWSSIVGNPDRSELAKHRRAGTQVARMKCKHFGYAVKYATKTEQKEVPYYFRDVGRFWGCWNYSSPDPVTLDLDFSRFNEEECNWVRKLILFAFKSSLEDARSQGFAMNRLSKSMHALKDGMRHKFGFTIFGSPGEEFRALIVV